MYPQTTFMSPSKKGVLAAKTKIRAAKKAKMQVFRERNAGDSGIGVRNNLIYRCLEENLNPKCKRGSAEYTEAILRSLSIETEIQEG